MPACGAGVPEHRVIREARNSYEIYQGFLFFNTIGRQTKRGMRVYVPSVFFARTRCGWPLRTYSRPHAPRVSSVGGNLWETWIAAAF